MESTAKLASILGEEQLMATLEGIVPEQSLCFARKVLFGVLHALRDRISMVPGNLSAYSKKIDDCVETCFFLNNKDHPDMYRLVAGVNRASAPTLYLKKPAVSGHTPTHRWTIGDVDSPDLSPICDDIARVLSASVCDILNRPAQA